MVGNCTPYTKKAFGRLGIFVTAFTLLCGMKMPYPHAVYASGIMCSGTN